MLRTAQAFRLIGRIGGGNRTVNAWPVDFATIVLRFGLARVASPNSHGANMIKPPKRLGNPCGNGRSSKDAMIFRGMAGS